MVSVASASSPSALGSVKTLNCIRVAGLPSFQSAGGLEESPAMVTASLAQAVARQAREGGTGEAKRMAGLLSWFGLRSRQRRRASGLGFRLLRFADEDAEVA